jgi:hypothetical protein
LAHAERQTDGATGLTAQPAAGERTHARGVAARGMVGRRVVRPSRGRQTVASDPATPVVRDSAGAVAGGMLEVSGALEPILEEWCQSFTGPLLYYPGRRLVPTPLRAFIDFIDREHSQRSGGLARNARPCGRT